MPSGGSAATSASAVSRTTSYSRPASRKPRFRAKLRDSSSSSRIRPHIESRPRRSRVLGEGLVDPAADPLSAVLRQDADHRVHAALDRGRAAHAAACRLVADRREEPGALCVRLDEVRDLVHVDDVPRDLLQDRGPLLVVPRGGRSFEPQLHDEPYAGRMAAPVRRDDELDLKIESLAYGGNGVARLNGFVVFVRRGLPGDVVRARVTRVKRNHAEAFALEVVEAGAPRVDAPCEHYPACGGCRFQDLAYEAQLEAKAAQVEEALRRIGRRRRPAARADRPRGAGLPLPEQARVLVHLDARRAGARLPPRRALGRGARHPQVLADDRPRERDPRGRPRLGARAGPRRRTTRPSTAASCATSSCARGATPARRSSSS